MTMIMSPAKVLDCQAELLTRLRTDERFNRFIRVVLKGQYQDARDVWLPDRIRNQTQLAAESLMLAVRAAEAYHVSADMTKVVQAAAAGLDDTDQFDSRLAPSAAGIVRFDGGLRMIDVRGAEMRIDWIVWRRSVFGVQQISADRRSTESMAPGIGWYEFNDAIDDPDEISNGMPEGTQVYGRWGLAGMNVATDGERLGAPLLRTIPQARERILADGVQPVLGTNTMRLLHAFFLLLQQQITVTSQTRPHPSARPGLKRARLPKDAKVTVVELRKHRYVNDGAGGHRQVEWDHRWLVRGFWRWQAHGPQHSQRRRIWVDDFVKGPEDRPLVIKNRVSDLRR